jgi:hypothetical protein
MLDTQSEVYIYTKPVDSHSPLDNTDIIKINNSQTQQVSGKQTMLAFDAQNYYGSRVSYKYTYRYI